METSDKNCLHNSFFLDVDFNGDSLTKLTKSPKISITLSRNPHCFVFVIANSSSIETWQSLVQLVSFQSIHKDIKRHKKSEMNKAYLHACTSEPTLRSSKKQKKLPHKRTFHYHTQFDIIQLWTTFVSFTHGHLEGEQEKLEHFRL